MSETASTVNASCTCSIHSPSHHSSQGMRKDDFSLKVCNSFSYFAFIWTCLIFYFFQVMWQFHHSQSHHPLILKILSSSVLVFLLICSKDLFDFSSVPTTYLCWWVSTLPSSSSLSYSLLTLVPFRFILQSVARSPVRFASQMQCAIMWLLSKDHNSCFTSTHQKQRRWPDGATFFYFAPCDSLSRFIPSI